MHIFLLTLLYYCTYPCCYSHRLSRGLFSYMQEQSRQPFQHTNGKLYNVQICLCLDKQALQALSGLGCGSFMGTFICTYCESTGNDKHTRSYYRCQFCVDHYDSDWPCTHKQMITHNDIVSACSLPESHPVMSIILKRYASTAAISVHVLRSHVMDRLQITSNSAGKSVTKCTKEELSNIISNFWALYEVNVENIESVDISVIRKQLHCRLPEIENRRAFCEMFAISNNTTDREMLRAVLYYAQRLEASRRSLCSDDVEPGSTVPGSEMNVTGSTNSSFDVGSYSTTANRNTTTTTTTTTTTNVTTPKLSKVVNTPEICIPCYLHLDMRVSEKLLSLLLERGIQQREDITQQQKAVIVKRLEMVISSLLSGGDGVVRNTHTHFTSVFELPSIAPGERIAVRMSGARLHKLFTNKNSAYVRMLEAVFGSTNNNGDNNSGTSDDNHTTNNPNSVRQLSAHFYAILEDYIYITTTLRTTHLFTNLELDSLQLRVDKFCYLYTSTFGATCITNYIHDLQSGHIMYFLRTYRSLYLHCNSGMEACIGCTTSHIMRGTQRGGHGGAKGQKYSIVQSIRDFFTQRVVYALSKISESAPAQFIANLVSSYRRSNKNTSK